MTYMIEDVQVKKTLPGKGNYGPSTVYRLQVLGEEQPVELMQDSTLAPPAIGPLAEGWEMVPGSFGKTFRKIRTQGGKAPQSGVGTVQSGYQRDPKESASIVRQHSQTVAVYWAAVMQKAHPDVKPNFEWLKGMIDWFDEDAKGAAK